MFRSARRLSRIVAIAAVLASCAPAYDPQTDNEITLLRQTTDEGIVRLIALAGEINSLGGAANAHAAPSLAQTCSDQHLAAVGSPSLRKQLSQACSEASYDANLNWYVAIISGLKGLESRMTASPDFATSSLHTEFAKLEENIALLQGLHLRNRYVGEAALTAIRTPINAEYGTLLHYELALRGGKNPLGGR